MEFYDGQEFEGSPIETKNLEGGKFWALGGFGLDIVSTAKKPSLSVRFSGILKPEINGEYDFEIFSIGPSRLSHGLIETNLDLPAIRDLASLMHDLSRLHWNSETELEIVHLRAALIHGWSSKAPQKWCSRRSFSAHTGGVVIWEYEQAMLDVVEAVSHQSGRPEPAVTIIEKVPLLQKSLFNSRILSAISTMSGICLLYTSPSPRDGLLSRMPSSA